MDESKLMQMNYNLRDRGESIASVSVMSFQQN